MSSRIRLLLLGVVVSACLGALSTSAPAAQAGAQSCGLTVKYPSSVRARAVGAFVISWADNSSGGAGTVDWYVQENASSLPGSSAHPYAATWNPTHFNYVVGFRLGGGRSAYHFVFTVDTGFCSETFTRTVQVRH